MNISQENIDALNAVIKVELTESDYQDKVDKVLKDYRKKVNLPGFRKGHVPMGMVKKMVGPSAVVDEVNKILSESLQKYLTENKLEVLGSPLPKSGEQEKIDWENQKEFEFKYEVGLAPKFDLELTTKFKFEQYKIKVGGTDVDKYIKDVSKRYGKMTNPEKSEEEDMLFGKFEELEKGQVKEGGITHSSIIVISEVTDKKLKAKLIGIKANDVIDELDVKKIAKNESDQAAAIGIKEAELKGVKSKFKFTVEKVNRILPALVNQELFDKIYGPNVVKSEDEFRSKVSEELKKGLTMDSERKLKSDIQAKLLEKLKLSLPDEFLKKWIVASNEKPISKEQIESEYEEYSKGLKWQLIENKIIKNNDVKVTNEEVVNYTKELLTQQMAGMGLPTDNEDELTETANRVLQNQEEAKNIYAMVYDKKLMELYKASFKLKEKEVSYEDFVKVAYTKK